MQRIKHEMFLNLLKSGIQVSQLYQLVVDYLHIAFDGLIIEKALATLTHEKRSKLTVIN
ncbi:hypothetical protein bcgnr5398_55560 [Bacillus cereus]